MDIPHKHREREEHLEADLGKNGKNIYDLFLDYQNKQGIFQGSRFVTHYRTFKDLKAVDGKKQS